MAPLDACAEKKGIFGPSIAGCLAQSIWPMGQPASVPAATGARIRTSGNGRNRPAGKGAKVRKLRALGLFRRLSGAAGWPPCGRCPLSRRGGQRAGPCGPRSRIFGSPVAVPPHGDPKTADTARSCSGAGGGPHRTVPFRCVARPRPAAGPRDPSGRSAHRRTGAAKGPPRRPGTGCDQSRKSAAV